MDIIEKCNDYEDTIENFNSVEKTVALIFFLFFSVSNVYCILCFSMIFDPITIAFNGFWSNDGMASMDRRDLDCLHLKEQTRRAQDCVGWGEPLHILPS